MAALSHTYRYRFPSALHTETDRPSLTLATSSAATDEPHPFFFHGLVREPRITSDLLVALSDVVGAHYFRPLDWRQLDPVVTSNEEMLRFEGFSGCCGVYARIDLPASAFESDGIQGRGTTNVDFNQPMRASLMQTGTSDSMSLGVGADRVEIERSGHGVIERKVQLPMRWIKGFSEVQAFQPGLQRRFEIAGADARRFLRSLPFKNPPKQASYVVSAGRGLRLSPRASKGAVAVHGVHRLQTLVPLTTRAQRLVLWADHDRGTSAWQVEFSHGCYTLLMSPEV